MAGTYSQDNEVLLFNLSDLRRHHPHLEHLSKKEAEGLVFRMLLGEAQQSTFPLERQQSSHSARNLQRASSSQGVINGKSRVGKPYTERARKNGTDARRKTMPSVSQPLPSPTARPQIGRQFSTQSAETAPTMARNDSRLSTSTFAGSEQSVEPFTGAENFQNLLSEYAPMQQHPSRVHSYLNQDRTTEPINARILAEASTLNVPSSHQIEVQEWDPDAYVEHMTPPFIDQQTSWDMSTLQVPPSQFSISPPAETSQQSSVSPQTYSQAPISPLSAPAMTHAPTCSTEDSLQGNYLQQQFEMFRLASQESFYSPIDIDGSRCLDGKSSSIADGNIHGAQSFAQANSDEARRSFILAGVGGATEGVESAPHSSSQTPSALPSFPNAEEMARSCSSESIASNSSTSSLRERARKRHAETLQVQASRPIFPKEEIKEVQSRPLNKNVGDSPSQPLESPDLSKSPSAVPIANKSKHYVRPKRQRVLCDKCNDHPEGFRGDHELKRHDDRAHATTRKAWVCVEPKELSRRPPVALQSCPKCREHKKYYAYYNAAAHLRRFHFHPRDRNSKNSRQSSTENRGGKGGGDDPPMSELKHHWIQEIEELVDRTNQSAEQQEATKDEPDEDAMADEESEDEGDTLASPADRFDERQYTQAIPSPLMNSTANHTARQQSQTMPPPPTKPSKVDVQEQRSLPVISNDYDASWPMIFGDGSNQHDDLNYGHSMLQYFGHANGSFSAF